MKRPLSASRPHTSGSPRGRGGFSLFEMLVVLVVLGILAGISGPALGRMLEGLRFRQQIGHYSAILRYARLLAISSGETVRLHLERETEDCVFELSGPVKESKDCGLRDQETLVMDPGDFYFFPEGGATPGTLTLHGGNRVGRLRLDLLTGRPELEGRQ